MSNDSPIAVVAEPPHSLVLDVRMARHALMSRAPVAKFSGVLMPMTTFKACHGLLPDAPEELLPTNVRTIFGLSIYLYRSLEELQRILVAESSQGNFLLVLGDYA